MPVRSCRRPAAAVAAALSAITAVSAATVGVVLTAPPAAAASTAAVGPLLAGTGPAVASSAAGRVDVVATAPDGSISHLWWAPASGWSQAEGLGGTSASSPSVTSPNPGEVDVFVRGTDNAVWAKTSTPTRPWGGWSRLGGDATSAPAAASSGAGRVVVLTRTSSGNPAVRTYDPTSGWGAWQTLPGQILAGSTPAAVGMGDGTTALAVTGTDRHAWLSVLDAAGRLSAWRDVGGLVPSGVALTSPSAGVVQLFARGLDDALYTQQLALQAAAPGWSLKGGILRAAPAAATDGATTNLAVAGGDGMLYTRSFTGRSWTPWFQAVASYTGATLLTSASWLPEGPWTTPVTSAPMYTSSHYASDLTGDPATDAQLSYDHGCVRAKVGNPGLVVVDYGAQNNGFTIKVFSPGLALSYPDIIAAARGWIRGFVACNTNPRDNGLILALGTNNSGNPAYGGYSGGQAWADVVNSVASWNNAQGYDRNYRVYVAGANDIEPGFGGPATARDWVDGYSSRASVPFYNYGSADGCPYAGASWSGCNNGWTPSDVLYVSAGTSHARALPEIYTPTSQASQWQKISELGVQTGLGQVKFAGAMTQNTACGLTSCPGTNNTPQQGWTALWNVLNSSPTTAVASLPFSTDIMRD